jgi:ABC-type nickel/cobalt efflux system permease component RcnA
MGWLALAAGSVPCTGAILVLLFGLSHNLLVPAILMVMMMSIGMAIAMSGIGILAIFGHNYAERKFINKSHMGDRFTHVLKVATASVILLIGIGMFTMTLGEKMQIKAAGNTKAVTTMTQVARAGTLP